MNDEYTVDDVQDIIDEIIKEYNGHSDIILKKTGSYSVNIEAQLILSNNIKEFGNFVYVADTKRKKQTSEFAVQTYMKSYNAQIAATKEEAYEILKAMR
jgi:flagellar biosynthesis GTPase FlhF